MTGGKINSSKDFLFKIPKVNPKLTKGATIALQLGALSSRDVEIKRTRCEHPDGRAENVAEHSLMLAKVAPELAYLLYPELDVNLVARFATLHDDVEAYVGDTPTDVFSNLDPKAKSERELRGLKQLVKEYSNMPQYVKLITEYENLSVPEARFVRAVDKLMVIIIHFPNNGTVIKDNYIYETFMKSEVDILKRDRHKYSEFEKIVELRKELASELANQFLLN